MSHIVIKGQPDTWQYATVGSSHIKSALHLGAGSEENAESACTLRSIARSSVRRRGEMGISGGSGTRGLREGEEAADGGDDGINDGINDDDDKDEDDDADAERE